MIEHGDANVAILHQSNATGICRAKVTMSFNLYYDDRILPGQRTEIVETKCADSCTTTKLAAKAIELARDQLYDYFDGGEGNDDNIFRDGFFKKNESGLTAGEEASLRHELRQIELSMAIKPETNRQTVSEKTVVNRLFNASSRNPGKPGRQRRLFSPRAMAL